MINPRNLTIPLKYSSILKNSYSRNFRGYMKKEILKIILEIFITTVIITFSFPVWQKKNVETENLDSVIAEMGFGLKVYVLESSNVKILNNQSDFKTNNIVVSNNTNVNRSGTLLLMFSKLSTINYKDLLININDKIYDLEDIFLVVNKDYYVFKIDDLNLAKYSNKNYLITYNVKENTLVENIIGKYFDANVQLTENSKL